MGNIALTTLVVLLLAMPGYIMRKFYYSAKFSGDVLAKNLTEEIYQSILYSLPFHYIAVALVDYLYVEGKITFYVDYELLIGFLTGKVNSDSDTTTKYATTFYQYLHHIGAYFVGTATLAGACGILLQRLVYSLKLDIWLPSAFRYSNKYFYTFSGRELEGQTGEYHFTVLDVMCQLTKEKTRLYRGVVVGFDTDSNGELKQIRLGLSYRGKFGEDNKHYWEMIPGTMLVLKYETIQSFNVTYIPESKFSPNSPRFLKDAEEIEKIQTSSVEAPSSIGPLQPSPDP